MDDIIGSSFISVQTFMVTRQWSDFADPLTLIHFNNIEIFDTYRSADYQFISLPNTVAENL